MLKIFVGKKKEYNELILKSLIYGPKGTQEIAQYITDNSEDKEKNIDSVRSVISRRNDIPNRNGRLQELQNKDYIKRNSKREWLLTDKGFGVSLTLFNDVDEIFPFIIPKMKDIMSQIYTIIEKNISSFFPKLNKNGEIKSKLFALLNKETTLKTFLESMRKFTNRLVKTGVDLDPLSNEEYVRIVHANSFQEIMTKKLFSF